MDGWVAFFRNSAVGRNHEKHENRKAIVAPPFFSCLLCFSWFPPGVRQEGRRFISTAGLGAQKGAAIRGRYPTRPEFGGGPSTKGMEWQSTRYPAIGKPGCENSGAAGFPKSIPVSKEWRTGWVFEGNDDDTVVFGKQPGDRVKEIAVRCQQDGLLLLANSKTARSSVPCSANSSTLHAEWPASFRKSAADFGKFSSRRKFMPPHDRRVPDSPSFGWRTQEPRQDRLS